MTGIAPVSGSSVRPPERSPALTLVRAPLVVRPVCELSQVAAWARYVESHPRGAISHHPDWCLAIQESFSQRGLHQIALRGDTVVGVMPLIEVRSPLHGVLLVGTPYSPVGGILVDEAEAYSALAAAAREMVEGGQSARVQLRSAAESLPGWALDRRYVHFARELPRSPAQAEAALPNKARLEARQARVHECLAVRHSQSDLAVAHRLYAQSARRSGVPGFPLAFFQAVLRRLGGRVWITTVLQRRRPIASALSVVFGETVSLFATGEDERLRCPGASSLLHLSLMQRAVDAGMHRIEWGRCLADDVSACALRRHLGFEGRVLTYQHYPAAVTQTEVSGESGRRLWGARQLWKRLPVFVTARLGGWISRFTED